MTDSHFKCTRLSVEEPVGRIKHRLAVATGCSARLSWHFRAGGVVGAASAGCVLAHRLTENWRHRVLLLEAGGGERRFWHDLVRSLEDLVRIAVARTRDTRHAHETAEGGCSGTSLDHCQTMRLTISASRK